MAVPVDAIFVDLDNTLIDTDTAIGTALVAALSHVGATIPDDMAGRLVDMWWADPGGWFKRYEAGEIGVTEQRRGRYLDVAAEAKADPEAFDEWQECYVDTLVSSCRLFDDTIAFLDAVAHLPLIVVTNVESRYQQRKIASVGLAERLPEVVGADMAQRAKPDPALFEIACERAGVSADRVIHVGDSWDADVVGAKRAGIRAVWIDRTGARPRDPMPSEVQRVTRLTDVMALVS